MNPPACPDTFRIPQVASTFQALPQARHRMVVSSSIVLPTEPQWGQAHSALEIPLAGALQEKRNPEEAAHRRSSLSSRCWISPTRSSIEPEATRLASMTLKSMVQRPCRRTFAHRGNVRYDPRCRTVTSGTPAILASLAIPGLMTAVLPSQLRSPSGKMPTGSPSFRYRRAVLRAARSGIPFRLPNAPPSPEKAASAGDTPSRLAMYRTGLSSTVPMTYGSSAWA